MEQETPKKTTRQPKSKNVTLEDLAKIFNSGLAGGQSGKTSSDDEKVKLDEYLEKYVSGTQDKIHIKGVVNDVAFEHTANVPLYIKGETDIDKKRSRNMTAELQIFQYRESSQHPTRTEAKLHWVNTMQYNNLKGRTNDAQIRNEAVKGAYATLVVFQNGEWKTINGLEITENGN